MVYATAVRGTVQTWAMTNYQAATGSWAPQPVDCIWKS